MEAPYELHWLNTGTSLLVCLFGPIEEMIRQGKQNKQLFRIAAFDLDGTIIKPRSGRFFPYDSTDWMFWDERVPSALRDLHLNGNLVSIMTDQVSLRFHDSVPDFKDKMEAILYELNVPLVLLISTKEDFYKKPAPGMWYFLKHYLLQGCEYSLATSFFVGDAAGRVAHWKPGKHRDWSMADRLFAMNIRFRFQTPEAHFLGEIEGEYAPPTFNPRLSSTSEDMRNILSSFEYPEFQVIVMVGLPASGKTTFIENHLVPRGFSVVARDIDHTWKECALQLKRWICARQRVVVDYSHVDIRSRKRVIDVCKIFGVVPRCFVMSCSFKRAQHNNRFRIIMDHDHPKIPFGLLKSSLANFKLPTVAEGFSDVVMVPLVPCFEQEYEMEIYNLHLLDPK